MIWRVLMTAVLIAAARAEAAVSLSEVREIAREAYVYGFPLVDNYRVIYDLALDQGEAEFNRLGSCKVRRFAHGKTYAIVVLDLRAEAMVLTLPADEGDPRDVLELADLATVNFAFLENHAPVARGGSYLVAGPNWRGTAPPGVTRVLRAESELAIVLFRSQRTTSTDVTAAALLEGGYNLQPLSAFAGEASPPPAPKIEFIEPLTESEEQSSLAFYNQLAFVLQFCPVDAGEGKLRERFARIGIVPGQPFGTVFLNAATKSALRAGMAEGEREINARQREFTDFDELLVSGSNENALQSDDAFMIPFTFDAGGELLDGSVHRYTLTFPSGQLPPTKGGWSLTLYGLPDQLPVPNAIDRHNVNSRMLGDMVTNNDGGMTIRIQKNPPGDDTEANWLPAPDGPFLRLLRLFEPEKAVRFNAWEAPPVERVD